MSSNDSIEPLILDVVFELYSDLSLFMGRLWWVIAEISVTRDLPSGHVLHAKDNKQERRDIATNAAEHYPAVRTVRLRRENHQIGIKYSSYRTWETYEPYKAYGMMLHDD